MRARVGAVARAAPFVLLAVSVAGLVGELVVNASSVPGVGGWFGIAAFPLITVVFAAVGALLARRRPRNPVGWALLVYGVGSVNVFSGSYAEAQHPGWELASWWYAIGWSFGMLALAAALLVFPDGRPLSPRWRVVVRVVLAGAGVIALAAALLWPHRGLVLLGDLADLPPGAELPFLLPTVVVGPSVLAALLSLALRYRRSRGVERLQLKWLVVALVPMVAGFLWTALNGTGPESPDAPVGATSLMIVGILAMPVSIAFAVLRYRLYDIDRLIHRGAVYSIVTAALVGTYLVSVLVLQQVLAPLGGGGDLGVAVSTLLVAAAFRPVRRQVQAAIDRRFNRRRYDAARVVDTFGQRLRDETDLRALLADVSDVTRRTVEPAHVSMWLPPAGDATA